MALQPSNSRTQTTGLRAAAACHGVFTMIACCLLLSVGPSSRHFGGTGRPAKVTFDTAPAPPEP
jgi:hypothetical protein